MQKETRSLLEELSNINLAPKRDREDVVESRASHILESAIRLLTYIRENFDQETAFKLEKKLLMILQFDIVSLFNSFSFSTNMVRSWLGIEVENGGELFGT